MRILHYKENEPNIAKQEARLEKKNKLGLVGRMKEEAKDKGCISQGNSCITYITRRIERWSKRTWWWCSRYEKGWWWIDGYA